MYHLTLYLLLIVLLLLGLGINLLNLPGLWLMVGAAAVYEWLTNFHYASYKTLIGLLLLAAVAEVMEFTSAGKAAKRAGGSRRAFWGAIVGGIVGGIVFSGLIPILIVGTVFGICLGTFLGALIAEFAGGTRNPKIRPRRCRSRQGPLCRHDDQDRVWDRDAADRAGGGVSVSAGVAPLPPLPVSKPSRRRRHILPRRSFSPPSSGGTPHACQVRNAC